MKPFVNLEEQIGKQVGNRRPASPLRFQQGEKQDSRQWKEHFGGIPVGRKGVFRFKTHEEADAWLWTKIATTKSH